MRKSAQVMCHARCTTHTVTQTHAQGRIPSVFRARDWRVATAPRRAWAQRAVPVSCQVTLTGMASVVVTVTVGPIRLHVPSVLIEDVVVEYTLH